MKILFLDVDGVLNYAGCAYMMPGTKMLGIDPKLVELVHHIVRETGCKIVLSSSWRLYKPDRDYIMENIAGIIDVTPDKRGLTDRGCEVIAWMDEHPEVTTHAILDDDSDFHKEQPLFLTKWDTGLTPEIAQLVIEHLNRAAHATNS